MKDRAKLTSDDASANKGEADAASDGLPLLKSRRGQLALAALGVVYGDIGTSPLYTIGTIFSEDTGVILSEANVIGAVSAIIWALLLVVTLKYVVLVLRADNRGEGGSLALTALATNAVRQAPRLRSRLLLLGVFGACLFYGEVVITPSISVMGALDGLALITPTFMDFIVPISIFILVILFAWQSRGTATVGKYFGPIIALWFLVIGFVGLWHILWNPMILQAFNPFYGLMFLLKLGPMMLIAVGAIVLAITGAEALYADMGHFGRKPIQLAWIGMVLPCLALNYLGQGALLLSKGEEVIDNPFYHLFPSFLIFPVLILATLAAIIASQAVISGAYSMTRQGILLGLLPRMRIKHTSAKESGQIYIPTVNILLLAGVIITVIGFGSADALAGAYGIAVTITMMVTTSLTFFVVRYGWGMQRWIILMATLFFLGIDSLLVLGCLMKFFDGGWFPLLLGLTFFTIMITWQQGRQLLARSMQNDGLELEAFIARVDYSKTKVAERTAIYPVSNNHIVPQALLHNLKHNQVLHRKNIILTVQFADVPSIKETERLSVIDMGNHFWKVIIQVGFMENPDVPKALEGTGKFGLDILPFTSTFFLSRETVVSTLGSGMMPWREKLFAAMSRNSSDIAEFFNLPDNMVVELGTRVQI